MENLVQIRCAHAQNVENITVWKEYSNAYNNYDEYWKKAWKLKILVNYDDMIPWFHEY